MRATTRTAAVVVVLVGALAGCSGTAKAPSYGGSPAFGVQPTGRTVTITSLATPQGTTPVTVLGVTVDVPTGDTSSTSSLDNGIKQLVVHDPTQKRAVATVTVTPVHGANDTAVDASSQTAEAQIVVTPGWSDVSLSPATWKGMPYATAIRATLTQDDGSKRDTILVTVRDAKGTKTVGVSAEAAHGQLDGCAGFAILRTLRFEG